MKTVAYSAKAKASGTDSKSYDSYSRPTSIDMKSVAYSSKASAADSKSSASYSRPTIDMKSVAYSSKSSGIDSKSYTSSYDIDSKSNVSASKASGLDSKTYSSSYGIGSKSYASSSKASGVDSKSYASSSKASGAESKSYTFSYDVATKTYTSAHKTSAVDSKSYVSSSKASGVDSKSYGASSSKPYGVDSKSYTSSYGIDSKSYASSSKASGADSKSYASSKMSGVDSKSYTTSSGIDLKAYDTSSKLYSYDLNDYATSSKATNKDSVSYGTSKLYSYDLNDYDTSSKASNNDSKSYGTSSKADLKASTAHVSIENNPFIVYDKNHGQIEDYEEVNISQLNNNNTKFLIPFLFFQTNICTMLFGNEATDLSSDEGEIFAYYAQQGPLASGSNEDPDDNRTPNQYHGDDHESYDAENEEEEEEYEYEGYEGYEGQYQYAEDDEDEEEEWSGIVPVLPIVVPKTLRPIYFPDEDDEPAADEPAADEPTTTKRPLEDAEVVQPDKKQKTTYDSSFAEAEAEALFGPNSSPRTPRTKRPLEDAQVVQPDKKQKTNADVPLIDPQAEPLKFDVNAEMIAREKEQEARVRTALLGTGRKSSAVEYFNNDPMLVPDLANEIFCNLFDSEPSMMADPGYADDTQHEITWRMRDILTDWIVELHHLFGLTSETLFLAVNIVDRFLSVRTIAMGKLQLVGVTALFIAAKVEEVFCPSIQDFLKETKDAVTEDELLKAEQFVLESLKFDVCHSHPMNFLRRLCIEEETCDDHTRSMAKFFMEASAMDHHFIGVRPSKVAAASLWLARKMLAKGKWTPELVALSGYSGNDLRPVVELFLDYFVQPVIHDAFFKKWGSEAYSYISHFVLEWVGRYYLAQSQPRA